MKSIIQINKKYRVSADEMNHDLEVLVAEHKAKKGKTIEDRWVCVGHYPSLSQCLHAVVKREMLNKDYEYIGAYIIELEKLLSVYSRLPFPDDSRIDNEINLESISMVFHGDGDGWLYRPNGEGMEIGRQELDKLLSDYYDGNF